MATIKVGAGDVINACRLYIGDYERDTTHDSDYSYEYKTHRDDALNDVLWLNKMAKHVDTSSYPYVILSLKDFQLIGKYL